MAARDWFRPARHLVAVFVLLAIVPSLLLIAFGWRLLQQDRALEMQQTRAAVEQAAELIAVSMEQQVASTEGLIRAGRAFEVIRGHHDSAAVTFSGRASHVRASAPLLFVPAPAIAPEVSGELFQRAEQIEFIERDPAGAAAAYARLSVASDAALRAAALIRLARVRRKAREIDGALEAYAQAASIPGVTVAGLPADLLARWARCDLFEKTGRIAALRAESGRLLDDLLSARWQLTRAQFEAHLADTSRWAGRDGASLVAAGRLALAYAVDALHQRWQERLPPAPFAGRSEIRRDGIRHALLWQESPDGAAGVAVGDDFVAAEWVSKTLPLAERHRVRPTLAALLPVTVKADALDPAVPGLFAGRRAIWLIGLVCLLIVMATGTYVVGRAVSRELAVARVQTDFVAAVSHEFRTPLTSLRQLTEMLIDRPPDADRARTYYDTLARQTERLHRLVENLLDFGRMEAGTSPYRLEPVDAGVFITEIARQFEADPAARAHRVIVQGGRDAGFVLADRDALARAVWNLLDNAAKYSPGAGDIELDMAREQGWLAIRVKDRGLGIPPSEQREIFAKFVRGATAKAENIGGTGIGLAMVRHIAAAHGGSIEVSSEPGRGSTFTLRLPAAAGMPSHGKEAAWLES